MSPKDPLLRTLKVCIMNLQTDRGIVTDVNPYLSSCCELLELILRKGLQQPVLSVVHRDYWHCFEQLLQHDTCGRLSAVSLAVEETSGCRKLLSTQGRGRYLLRLAFIRRLLERVIKHLLHTPKVLEWYNPAISLLRNEEFLEPFLSLLKVLSEMDFNLDMKNCSFLDESWLLPVCEIYEAVPCHELGMELRYLSGRVFVLKLLPGSQAQVDNCVHPGDIIDEINGTSLRNASNGQAGVILSRLKGCSLSLCVIRCWGQDGGMYRPIIKLIRALREENPSLQFGPSPSSQQLTNQGQMPTPSQCLKDGRVVYIVQFLGKVNTGMYGGKEVLQHAIPLVLQKNQPGKEVRLDLKETHLTCTEISNKIELFQHHYPEISCVGRFGKPDYKTFAFCVSDSPETPQATGFCCMVLRTSGVKECEEIVNCIAAGFKQTEWFV
ncbi:hypothetical protein UPYG_G00136470 [Umbra pygmaea]|uniref:RUN domain-containing protein n=1 Tax=Umbra pygmaea TaxID=75934 RepID=A0ABD0XCQ1_UMBPY